jgi:hypothetical protein
MFIFLGHCSITIAYSGSTAILEDGRIKGRRLMLKDTSVYTAPLTIKEVEERLEVSKENIKRWERAGWVTSSRNEFNHRVYSRDDVRSIALVVTYRGWGLSSSQIERLLAAPAGKARIRTKEDALVFLKNGHL